MSLVAQPLTILKTAAVERNPAWVQLLGLCPLLAVSNTFENALALSLASLFVVTGSNVLVSVLRHVIPDFVRLPIFVLIIATFTTVTTMVLEAYAYEIYLEIALFVQIIVTNCMILGRAEQFASRQPVGRACLDALGTGFGFAVALIILGTVRELLADGGWLPLASYAPGAFIVAGLLYALVHAIAGFRRGTPGSAEHATSPAQEYQTQQGQKQEDLEQKDEQARTEQERGNT